ncbi:MAG: hypothetical protein NW204_00935 [Xanthomonadaceae bacterium]|nr:hypothetical protein [Xanthomonadaceae bacterium]
MDRKRKSSFDIGMGAIVKKPKPLEITPKLATGKTWSKLSEKAQKHSATVFKHDFTLGDKDLSITTSHLHNDFQTFVHPMGGGYQLPKFNVSTSPVGEKARTLDDLVGKFGSRHKGATNTMRVLKGKETAWKLIGTSETRASRAVELAAEIGISEFSRGGTHALVNAMSGLYLMKHSGMTKEEFLDPKVGYRGAGDGGAGRLRQLQKKGLSEALHIGHLRKHYDTTAVNKPGKAWTGKKSDQGFSDWLEHKVTKWTGRQ